MPKKEQHLSQNPPPSSLRSPTNFHTTFLRTVRLTLLPQTSSFITPLKRVQACEATESGGQEFIVLLSLNEWSGMPC